MIITTTYEKLDYFNGLNKETIIYGEFDKRNTVVGDFGIWF